MKLSLQRAVFGGLKLYVGGSEPFFLNNDLVYRLSWLGSSFAPRCRIRGEQDQAVTRAWTRGEQLISTSLSSVASGIAHIHPPKSFRSL